VVYGPTLTPPVAGFWSVRQRCVGAAPGAVARVTAPFCASARKRLDGQTVSAPGCLEAGADLRTQESRQSWPICP
jgi:hypothetical protein